MGTFWACGIHGTSGVGNDSCQQCVAEQRVYRGLELEVLAAAEYWFSQLGGTAVEKRQGELRLEAAVRAIQGRGKTNVEKIKTEIGQAFKGRQEGPWWDRNPRRSRKRHS